MSAVAAVEPAPLRTVAYLRISEDRTGEALGVERQEEDCRALCERLGWEIVEVISDNDTSAFSRKPRAGWQRVLRLVETGAVDAIVAWSTDRLYRRMSDLEHLVELIERQRVEIQTCVAGEVDLTTANGRMVARIMGSVAQADSEKSSERIKRAMRQSAQKGRAHGGVRPYGYRRPDETEPPEPMLIVVPDEAAVVREMAAAILDGESLTGLTKSLNERRVPTATGKSWNVSQVRRTLASPRVAGFAVHEGEIAGPAGWDAILDEVTWRRVTSKLSRTPQGRRPKVNLLAGLAHCVKCGSRMASSTSSDPSGGPRIRIYTCDRTKGDACGSNSIRADRADAIVVEHVLGFFATTNLGRLQAARAVEDATGLVAEIARDEQFLNDLAADMGARKITRAEWLAAREPVEERLRSNRGALAALDDSEALPDEAFVKLDESVWDGLSVEQKRSVIRLAVERVDITKGRRGARFDPGRVQITPR